MKRYYKVTEGEKLLLIGIGEGGEEITQEEYNSLLEEIRNSFVIPEEETEDGESMREEG